MEYDHNKWVISVHESAHAIGFIVLKKKFSFITVKPDGDIMGNVAFDQSIRGFGFHYYEPITKYKMKLIKRDIVIFLLGDVVEKIYRGYDFISSRTLDTEYSEKIATQVGMDDKTLLSLWNSAFDIYEGNLLSIQAVARELYNKETLRYFQVRSIAIPLLGMPK